MSDELNQVDLVMVVNQLIDYNDVMVHDEVMIMIVHMDQHLNIPMVRDSKFIKWEKNND